MQSDHVPPESAAVGKELVPDESTSEQPAERSARHLIGGVIGQLWFLPAMVLISVVRFYQICLSPFLPSVCRFTPTCSTYFIQSVRKYGAIKGSIKGAWRICRCQPWGGCGHDPP